MKRSSSASPAASPRPAAQTTIPKASRCGLRPTTNRPRRSCPTTRPTTSWWRSTACSRSTRSPPPSTRSSTGRGSDPSLCGRARLWPMSGAPAQRISELKEQLDALRPLRGAALLQLQKHFDVELTFTSNAIEGNTLTLRETAEVIEHGITVGGKSLREHLEALDHYNAVLWIRELANNTTP